VPSLSRWSRQFHRWIAYGLGVLVLVWVVTGVVMMFPPAPTIKPTSSAHIDPSAAARSPSDALQAVPETARPVRSVSLKELDGKLVYDFVARGGAHILVDAATAQPVMLSDSLAASLVRRVLADSTITFTVRQITEYDQNYRFGVLPAFRAELNDASRTLVHIAADGTINSSSNRSRFRAVMAALHEFQLPGQIIPNRMRKLLLLGASALTIVLALTGYILVLPARRRG
jgi:uncharacterized iron-regulated membrane protein